MDPQSLYCELLTLRKPTKVDDLVNSVEKPRGTVPKKDGFPLWNVMKLDAKLPVLQEPKEKFVFTRDKLGHKLWRDVGGQEFTLSDPYCIEISYDYDPLHDPNLRPFFCRKANRDHMRDLGLATPSGDAVCSLRKFNEYRRYLKRMHVDAINRERALREENAREQGLIDQAQERLDKDLAYQTKAAERLARAKDMKKRVEQEYLDRRQSWLDSQARHALRVQAIAVHQRNEAERRKLKSQANDEKIRSRCRQADDFARRKTYKTLKKWHQDERARAQRLAREAREARDLKKQGELHHYEQKVKAQNARVKRVKKILAGYEKDRAIQVEIRNEHVAAEREKLDNLLIRIKASRLRHCAEKGKLWTMPTMVRALSRAWENEQMMLTGGGKVDVSKVEKSLNMQIAESKNKPEGKEVLAILQAAKTKLDKDVNIPDPVSISIDAMLDNVVYDYTRKNVQKLITDVAEKSINCSNQLEQVALDEEQKKFGFVCGHTPNSRRASATRRLTAAEGMGHRVSIKIGPDEIVHLPRRSSSNISPVKTSRRTSSKDYSWVGSETKVQRLVSFGTVSTIATPVKLEDDKVSFMKTKDRPPTPVPSMTELVNAVFVEPIELDRDAANEDMEKKNLDKLFHSLGKNLLMAVLIKAEKGMECNRRNTLSLVHSHVPVIDLPTVVDRIVEMILSEENVNLMETQEMNQVRDVLVNDLLYKRRVPGNAETVCHKRRSTVEKKQEKDDIDEQKPDMQKQKRSSSSKGLKKK